MKKIDLNKKTKEYYCLEIEKQEIIDFLNYYLTELKKIDNKSLLINPDKVKKVDKQFSRYAIDIIYNFEILIIRKTRSIYYDRESFWNVQQAIIEMISKDIIDGFELDEEETEFQYIKFIENMMLLIYKDNCIAPYFRDFFFLENIIEPEDLPYTDEEKQAYKKELDNVLKPYY